LSHAYSIQRHIESAVLDIQSEDLEPEGSITVGMVPTINNAFASRLYDSVQERFPKLQLNIVGGPSIYLNRQLENRRLDICITHSDSVGFGELTVKPVFKESLFFVGAKSKQFPHIIETEQEHNKIRFSDIVNYETLSTEAQDGLGFRICQYEKEYGVTLNKRSSLGQLTSDLNEILKGTAEMILPWSAIYHISNDDVLTTAQVVDPSLERDIFLLTNPKSPLTLNMIKTQNLIEELIPSLFADGQCVGQVFERQ